MIKRLTSIVISVHLLLILFLLLTPTRLPVKKNLSVKVRTVSPAVVVKSPRQIPQRPPSPPQPQKTSPPKRQQAPKPIPPAKAAAAKKSVASKKPAVIEKGKPVK